MTLSSMPSDCLARARLSLDGLSVGDAFGQRFFGPLQSAIMRIDHRVLPDAPWRWTDDTHMALSIVEVLEQYGTMNGDALAEAFARRYVEDPRRGYGGMAHEILSTIAEGGDWRAVSQSAFGGQGSCGNGAAMRIAPLGAWFAYDLERVAREALLSAAPTHAHPEGAAGAVAIACAAAIATRMGAGELAATRESFFAQVLPWIPRGEIRDGVERAAAIDPSTDIESVAAELGSGNQVLAQDTVPFALWCAARSLSGFVDAMWTTVTGLGDRDTTCAMVGGIVAMSASVPEEWLTARESLG